MSTRPRHEAPGTSARSAAVPQGPKPALEAAALVYLASESQDVFHRCVTLALDTTRATTALALLLRSERGVLEVVSAAGHLARAATGRRARPGEALAWRVMQTGQPLLVQDAYAQPDALFVSGRPRPGAYLGVPLSDPDGQVFGVLSVDTTDSAEVLDSEDLAALTLLAQAAGVAYARLCALEHARRTAARFQRLAQLSADLELRSGPDEIAGQALDALMELSGFASGGVFGVRAGRLELRVLAGVDQTTRRTWAAQVDGLAWRVIREGATVQLDHRDPWWASLPGGAGASLQALAAPLRARGEVVGAIGLATTRRRPVSPESLTLLEMVAARLERAMERASGVEHLRQMREAALRGLGRVLERRDDETKGHTDRVTALALRLGTALGLDEHQLRDLRWGAYLHDVGKVAVPDAILCKPGPLTPQERAVMQTHAVTGDDLLRDDDFLPRTVAAVVRHHHERWDGGGYPDGLSGEAIPLLARVFSVVDVYDALVSERPYKRAWSAGAACAELARGAGSQFDPWVVQAFLALE